MRTRAKEADVVGAPWVAEVERVEEVAGTVARVVVRGEGELPTRRDQEGAVELPLLQVSTKVCKRSL